MLYVALCDLVLNKSNGAPDFVKAGEHRDFELPPFQGRTPKWAPLDEAAPVAAAEPRKTKKSPTDIDKPFTGVRALTD